MLDRPRGIGFLTEGERELVRQCLVAAVEGPFFPEWEFHTIFGVEREEVAAVLARWPQLDESKDVDRSAVNNSLNNLLGYPHGCEAQWSAFIDAPPSEVARVLAKWRGNQPGSYFEALE